MLGKDASGGGMSVSCEQEERALQTAWRAGTGPKTAEGRARVSAARLRHGKFTKDKLEERRANAAKEGKSLKERLRIARDLIPRGLLDKHWRDDFLSQL